LLLLVVVVVVGGGGGGGGCGGIYFGRTYYLHTASAYVKFVGYNLAVSHRRHVCNCWLITVFHAYAFVGRLVICQFPSSYFPLITAVKLKDMWNFFMATIVILRCQKITLGNVAYFQTSVTVEFMVLWVVAPCSVVVGYPRFGGPCCLHLQSEVSMA
jgi:hypothetical protein